MAGQTRGVTVDGRSKHRLYPTWSMVIARCYNPNTIHYEDYGGRGITVCDEWRNDFYAFEEWAMSHGWEEGLTLDRINNDAPYFPSNCKWSTRKEQAVNRRKRRDIPQEEKANQDIRQYLADNNVTIKEFSEAYGCTYMYVEKSWLKNEQPDVVKEVMKEVIDKIIRERGRGQWTRR